MVSCRGGLIWQVVSCRGLIRQVVSCRGGLIDRDYSNRIILTLCRDPWLGAAGHR